MWGLIELNYGGPAEKQCLESVSNRTCYKITKKGDKMITELREFLSNCFKLKQGKIGDLLIY